MMRPSSVDLWDVTLPMRRGFRSAQGELTVRRSILVRVAAGDTAGWGEAAPYPGHTRDDVDEAWTLLATEAGRLLAGEDPVLIEGSTATAALDGALADVRARLAGAPLAAFLGGEVEPVPASATLDLQPDDAKLLAAVADAVAAGYPNVKLKIDRTSLRQPAAVRIAHPGLGLAVDANGSLDQDDIASLAALDELELAYIEQPLPPSNPTALAALQQRMETPICLDESIVRLADITAAGRDRLAAAITLKPGRLGPTLTLRGLELAARHGLEVKLGGLVETGVGRAMLVALATHPGVTLPSDLAAGDHWFPEDIVRPEWRIAAGCLTPRTMIEVDEDRVAALAHRHVSLGG